MHHEVKTSNSKVMLKRGQWNGYVLPLYYGGMRERFGYITALKCLLLQSCSRISSMSLYFSLKRWKVGVAYIVGVYHLSETHGLANQGLWSVRTHYQWMQTRLRNATKYLRAIRPYKMYYKIRKPLNSNTYNIYDIQVYMYYFISCNFKFRL